jgi:hypothetical protein
MAHSSEKRWDDISRLVSDMAAQTLEIINRGEEIYLQLFEVWEYTGGTPQLFAQQVFKEQIEARGGSPTEVTAEELTQATDAAAAALALHELWQAANNIAVTTDDRSQKLRRMV